jgi:hypothetical protein
MRDLPDLSVNYREGSFDKDVGYCATEVTLTQAGERVSIHRLYTENDQEVSEGTVSGTITRIYAAEGLAQITLDDGARCYFDLADKKLRTNLEYVSEWFELDSQDIRDQKLLALIIGWINRIARDLEPAFEVDFDEEVPLEWGEPYHPFADYGYPQQRNREAIAGDPVGFHCRLTFREEPDQSSAYRPSNLLLEAVGLPPETSVSFTLTGYGRHTVSARSPIEKQAALLGAIKECLPAKQS